jgi:hypothetical protein
MLMPRQQYSRDMKVATMREIDSGKSTAEVARMFQVSPRRLETSYRRGCQEAFLSLDRRR